MLDSLLRRQLWELLCSNEPCSHEVRRYMQGSPEKHKPDQTQTPSVGRGFLGSQQGLVGCPAFTKTGDVLKSALLSESLLGSDSRERTLQSPF